jgi:hypothetical protein
MIAGQYPVKEDRTAMDWSLKFSSKSIMPAKFVIGFASGALGFISGMFLTIALAFMTSESPRDHDDDDGVSDSDHATFESFWYSVSGSFMDDWPVTYRIALGCGAVFGVVGIFAARRMLIVPMILIFVATLLFFLIRTDSEVSDSIIASSKLALLFGIPSGGIFKIVWWLVGIAIGLSEARARGKRNHVVDRSSMH